MSVNPLTKFPLFSSLDSSLYTNLYEVYCTEERHLKEEAGKILDSFPHIFTEPFFTSLTISKGRTLTMAEGLRLWGMCIYAYTAAFMTWLFQASQAYFMPECTKFACKIQSEAYCETGEFKKKMWSINKKLHLASNIN